MRRFVLTILAAMAAITTSAVSPAPSDRVQQILSSMTIEDKIGQMSQVDLSQIVNKSDGQAITERIQHYFGTLGVGSILNCPNSDGPQWNASQYRAAVAAIREVTDNAGRPPVIWGLDSVHGANYVRGAVMTPQQINLAATFNETVAFLAGRMASKDTRAAGITWLFSPILGLALKPSWSRVYETFGEDPLVAATMGANLIRGIQEPDDGTDGIIPSRAAACAKHFVGYSMPRTGHDRSPSWIPVRHLYQYFVRPWREAIRRAKDDGTGGGGVLTVMESYSEYDGVPNVANYDSLRRLLREELGFDGVLVTDYHEVENLAEFHHVAADKFEAVKLMLRDGSVDMSMVPLDMEGFKDQVLSALGRSGKGPTEYPPLPRRIDVGRVDESAERVLRLKDRLNMFDERVVERNDASANVVGSAADRASALELARQGIVLVENRDGTLPIPADASLQIHVTGPTSHSLRYQSGGWTVDWQGSPSDDFFTYGTTVRDAASRTPRWHVTHSCGVSILGTACQDNEDASPSAAAGADYIIACVGEESYTEKPGDIRSLTLAQGQIDWVKQVKATATGKQKVIVVYFGGRPRLLGDIPEHADAIFIGFLPGPDAGQAVIDLISGRSNPSGRLPITYPKYEDGAGAPYNGAVTDLCTRGDGTLPHWDNVRCGVQWAFGHGVSYSVFHFSNLETSKDQILFTPPGKETKLANDDDSVLVSVDVKNVGSLAGSEVAMFFLFDESRYATPEHKRLKFFTKTSLQPGESSSIEFQVTLDDLRHVGPHDDSHYVLQEGMKFRVGVGPDIDCRKDAAESDDRCTGLIQLNVRGEGHYIGACDLACSTWQKSNCSEYYKFDQEKCWTLCTNIAEMEFGEQGRQEGWGWNYVKCIESVSRGIKASVNKEGGRSCWKMTMFCRDIFSTVEYDEYGDSPVSTQRYESLVGFSVASFAALAGSILILLKFRSGGRSECIATSQEKKKVNGDVEFTPLSSKGVSEQELHDT